MSEALRNFLIVLGLFVVSLSVGFVAGRYTKPKGGETGQIQTCKQGETGCDDSLQLPF